MTLTVRLDDTLDSALTRYCREAGVSKSLVVQESLAAYLVKAAQAQAQTRANGAAAAPSVSANHRAFTDAGLIGVVAQGEGATKAAVRARVTARKSAIRAQAGAGQP